jgi:DNA topoisomerase I
MNPTRKKQLKKVENRLPNVRAKVRRDLRSTDDRTALKALAVALMLQTGERPGNLESSENGHFGICYLPWASVTVSGSSVRLRYVGKSGVKHDKIFSDKAIGESLTRFARGRHVGDRILTARTGEVVSADAVNKYFRGMTGTTTRNIRALKVNQLVSVYSKSDASTAIKRAAKKIGHGAAVLKKYYLK